MQSKLVSIALGAVGLGALVSWAVTADYYERRLITELDAALKIIGDKQEYIGYQAAYITGLQGVVNQLKNGEDVEVPQVDPNQGTLDEEEAVVVVDVVDDPYSEVDAIPEGQTLEETRRNLQNIIDNYTADPDKQEDHRQFVDRVVIAESSPPFVISRADYAYDEEGESYSKITLQYYPRDRVLLDDDEDPVDDIQGMVGWRNLSKFGGESEDPDTVFIRNRRLETDFEVEKDDDRRLPLHIQFGMEKEEFRANKAAGLIRLPREDE